MAKSRTEIPADVSAKVLFEQNHTCCLCHVRGLTVQIHHIDDDPTNHRIENLAVLCLEDHNRTQMQGGFGRKLGALEVIEYRNDWVTRVRDRRDRAVETAGLAEQISFQNLTPSTQDWTSPSPIAIRGYVGALPLVRRAAYAAARPRWDSGIGAEMREGTYEVIDVLEQVLNHLASFYPPGHFDKPPQEYFSSYITSRFKWYSAIYQPSGHNTGGTMVGEIVAGSVMTDIAALIEQMIEGLYFGMELETFDLDKWRKDWEAASNLQAETK